MNFSQTKIVRVFLFLFITSATVFLSGCGAKPPAYVVDLEIWGLFDDSDTFNEAIVEYKKINPHVGEIKYRKLTDQGYKKEVVDAMAAGKGPNIFLMQNTWLPYFQDKVEPISEKLLTEREFRSNFVDVAGTDFIKDGKVYALPLGVNSLALYYNRDLLNAVGLTNPPATWAEVGEYARRLTRIDSFGNIAQAGIAMGTASNINKSVDILYLLMLQNQVEMIDDRGRIGFDNQAGTNMLELYTQFARSNSPFYTWNLKQHYSVDAFAEGKLAMMINYPYFYEGLKAKNAKLNMEVAPVPQADLAKPVNYASYWGFTAAKNKKKEEVVEAWEFIKFLTVKNTGKVTLFNAISGESKDFPVTYDAAKKYFEQNKVPAARRDIIETQKSDYVLAPFAQGNLIAKSWPQTEPELYETILSEAISTINAGGISTYDALKAAVERMNRLNRR